MKKYNRPEIVCRVFAAENIVTASDPQDQQQTSVQSVQAQMQSSESGLAGGNVITENWN